MDLEHFIKNYAQDTNIARQVALYIIKPENLSPAFQHKNYFRGGVAGSRELKSAFHNYAGKNKGPTCSCNAKHRIGAGVGHIKTWQHQD